MMSPDRRYRPLIAITAGDPAGIGPEIAVMALRHAEIYDRCRPFIIGACSHISRVLEIVHYPADIQAIDGPQQGRYQAGTVDVLNTANVDLSRLVCKQVSRMAGQASLDYVHKAIDLALNKTIDAFVTGPINKEAIHLAGCPFAGHTEILAHRTGVKDFSSMLAVGNFRVMHVTLHTSLKNAIASITKHSVLEMIRLAQRSLQEMGIANPRIAVPGLNPHSSDGGLFGDEESREILPAIEAARAEGISVDGPVPPDSVFVKARGGKYDIVVALYHDQGHIPAKFYGWEWDESIQAWTAMRGVSVVLGLPIIRTNPDHGTAFDIAGEGRANPEAMVEAVELAIQMVQGRMRQKTARALVPTRRRSE